MAKKSIELGYYIFCATTIPMRLRVLHSILKPNE